MHALRLPSKLRIDRLVRAESELGIAARRDIDVFVTGGHLHGDWFSLVGPTAIRSLENMLIHTMFVGSDGLDSEWGASCYIESEAELNAAMLRQSRRHIAVVDHTKFGMVTNWRICETGNLQTIVTDSGTTDEMVAPFVALGIEVIRA